MTRTWKLKIAVVVAFVVVVMTPVLMCQSVMRSTVHYYAAGTIEPAVSLREFPYPFEAAVAISNDVDGIETLSEFLAIQEFLSTSNETPLGQGIDLDIGDTFFAKSERFGLLSPHPEDRKVILDLISTGHIDGIHSFDEARSRHEIEQVTNVLTAAGATVDVWINHSDAPSNLGPTPGYDGDDAGTESYHTDFSLDRLGYSFVWLGAVSGVVGQGRPISYGSFFGGFDRRFPLRSLYHNVLKEQVKFTLAAFGNETYAMRRNNELVRVTALDDGRPVFEFSRANQCYYGLWACATAEGVGHSLREEILRHLIRAGGYMIVYTHLGKNDGPPYLPPRTVEALRRLSEKYREGSIWVTTTSRLLRYYVNKKYLMWETHRDKDGIRIVIQGTDDPVRGKRPASIDGLKGVTFYVDDPQRTEVFVMERKIIDVVINEEDATGRKSVTIPRQRLPRLDATMATYKTNGYF